MDSLEVGVLDRGAPAPFYLPGGAVHPLTLPSPQIEAYCRPVSLGQQHDLLPRLNLQAPVQVLQCLQATTCVAHSLHEKN